MSAPKAMFYLSRRYGVPIVSDPKDIDGLTTVFFSLHSFRDFYSLARLAQHKPEGQVWIAGGNAAVNPTAILWCVDYVFVGEAFQAFGDIMRGARDIPGMVDTRNIKPTRYYEEPLLTEPLRDNEFVISKGCPRRCLFCVHGFRETYEEADRDSVFDYVRNNRRKGFFLASNSSADVSYYGDLTDLLRATGKTDMAISSALNATTDEMVAGRRREMLFGIEGMSEPLRRIVNKPIPQATLRERVAALLRGGMQVRTVYQFNIPGERADDLEEMKSDVDAISKGAGTGSWSIPFIPNQVSPHTPMQWESPRYSIERVGEIMALRKSFFGQKRNGVSIFMPAPLYPRSWFRQTIAEWVPVTPELDRLTETLPQKAPVSEYVNRCLDSGVDVTHVFQRKEFGFVFPWSWITVRASESELQRFARIMRQKLESYGRAQGGVL